MATTNPKLSKGIVEEVLDDTISDEEMDRLFAERRDEIDGLLQEAYDARARGEYADLEPLHVLLAEERARFKASHR